MAGLRKQGRKMALCDLGLLMNTRTRARAHRCTHRCRHTEGLALGLRGYRSSSRVQAGKGQTTQGSPSRTFSPFDYSEEVRAPGSSEMSREREPCCSPGRVTADLEVLGVPLPPICSFAGRSGWQRAGRLASVGGEESVLEPDGAVVVNRANTLEKTLTGVL